MKILIHNVSQVMFYAEQFSERNENGVVLWQPLWTETLALVSVFDVLSLWYYSHIKFYYYTMLLHTKTMNSAS